MWRWGWRNENCSDSKIFFDWTILGSEMFLLNGVGDHLVCALHARTVIVLKIGVPCHLDKFFSIFGACAYSLVFEKRKRENMCNLKSDNRPEVGKSFRCFLSLFLFPSHLSLSWTDWFLSAWYFLIAIREFEASWFGWKRKNTSHCKSWKVGVYSTSESEIWLLCHVHVASSVSWKTGCSVMFETLQHAATKVHWCVVSSPSYRQGQQTTTWLKLQQHEHYDHTEVICFATNSSKVSQLGSKMLEVWTKGMQFWTNLAWCTHFTLLTCFAT